MQLQSLLLLLIAIATEAGSRLSGRLNQIQVLHWHNTYHKCAADWLVELGSSPIAELLFENLGSVGDDGVGALEYASPGIREAISTYGARSVEIDVNYDPDGGRFSLQAGPKLARNLVQYQGDAGRGPPELDTPGWKVLHIVDLDVDSTCNTLEDCLKPIVEWHTANPNHHPLFLRIEAKTHFPKEILGAFYAVADNFMKTWEGEPYAFAGTDPADAKQLRNLESVLLTMFNRGALYTPDNFMRGSNSTIREVINSKGFPPIKSMLGHIVPILCGNGDFQDIYDEMYPEAKGGLFFVERYADDRDFNKEHHLFVQVGAREIERSLNLSRSLVERGYMVRFMEDNTRMSVDNLTQLRDRIIKESGAHFYHSNFVGGWTSLSAGGCGAPSNYTVELTNAKGQQLASACNPVTSHKQCFTKKTCICEEAL